MILKTDKQILLEDFRKNKHVSYTVKTVMHIAAGFALIFCYSKEIKSKKNDYFITEKKIVWVYLLKRLINLRRFCKFPKARNNFK